MHARSLAVAISLLVLSCAAGAQTAPRGAPGADEDRGGTPPGVSRSGSGPMDGAVIDKTRPGTSSDRANDPCEHVPNDEKLACKTAQTQGRGGAAPAAQGQGRGEAATRGAGGAGGAGSPGVPRAPGTAR